MNAGALVQALIDRVQQYRFVFTSPSPVFLSTEARLCARVLVRRDHHPTERRRRHQTVFLLRPLPPPFEFCAKIRKFVEHRVRGDLVCILAARALCTSSSFAGLFFFFALFLRRREARIAGDCTNDRFSLSHSLKSRRIK